MIHKIEIANTNTGPQEYSHQKFLIHIDIMILLLSAFCLRVATFGDTNLQPDEEFYFLVGQRMHAGILPYIDVWDRKPLGLFIIYYLIAGVSRAVIAYQITATIFASITSIIVYFISKKRSGRQGGILAGLSYLLLIGTLLGYGGQSPVFYNLFIATAAFIILNEVPWIDQTIVRWRIFVAMTLCGLAITIKQTTIFESVFFGFYVVVSLWRSGASIVRISAYAAAFGVIGALPMAMIAIYYWAIGHWPEFWQAMVTSNLIKRPPALNDIEIRALIIGLSLIPVTAFSMVSILSQDNKSSEKGFIFIWILASLIGCMIIPNFSLHYFLPILVPLSVSASFILNRKILGLIAFTLLAGWSVFLYNPFNYNKTKFSINSMKEIVKIIKKHDHGRGLLVFDGPPYLYALTEKQFMTPLIFPYHLNFLSERNVSNINTDREVDRIINNKPETIVLYKNQTNLPANDYSVNKIHAYIATHCHTRNVVSVYNVIIKSDILIESDCM